MLRRFTAILFASLLLPLVLQAPLQAQGRGGGHRGGGGRGAPPAGMARGHVVARGAPPVAVAPRGAVVPQVRIPPVVTPFAPIPGATVVHPRTRVVFQGPVIGPYGYGPYGFGPYGTFGGYAPYVYTEPIYTPPASVPYYTTPTVTPNEDLTLEVQRLRDQIEQLQQDQALAAARQPEPVSPAPPAAESAPVPTTLVFKDGHRMIIQNYVIVGDTLWVLDQRNSSKIPLSDLDLDTTQSLNRSQGSRFPVTAR
jgi:hypothetical protein